MKNTLLFLCFLSTLITSSCQKGASIKGIVLDDKTNQPIPGVKLRLSYSYSSAGSKKSATAEVVSDASGEFSFSNDEKYSESISVVLAIKNAYSFAFKSEYRGNDATIKLVPLDGSAKLTVLNESGLHDSIYIELFTKCQFDPPAFRGISITNPYPLTLPQGGAHTEIFPACVGDSSTVRWKFSRTDPWFQNNSVLVATADTVLFDIKY